MRHSRLLLGLAVAALWGSAGPSEVSDTSVADSNDEKAAKLQEDLKSAPFSDSMLAAYVLLCITSIAFAAQATLAQNRLTYRFLVC